MRRPTGSSPARRNRGRLPGGGGASSLSRSSWSRACPTGKCQDESIYGLGFEPLASKYFAGSVYLALRLAAAAAYVGAIIRMEILNRDLACA
jgi:hypothetical protein